MTVKPEQLHGSLTFYALLEQMKETHNRKSHDYASNENPYGNYHFAGMLSLLFPTSPEDAGFIGRIGEKIFRLANLQKDGKKPLNETVEDTEIDIATITILWMADRRDRRIRKLDLQPRRQDQVIGDLPLQAEADKKQKSGITRGLGPVGSD